MKRARALWRPSETASANAQRVLPEMVRTYFKQGRKLSRESNATEMHRFRLMTKHLRYTLEAFVALYGPGLRSRVAGLRPIQNALGDANDCEVLIAEMGDRLSEDVRVWVAKRAEEKRKEFLRYWRESFDARDEDKKWEKYLSRTRPTRTRPSQT